MNTKLRFTPAFIKTSQQTCFASLHKGIRSLQTSKPQEWSPLSVKDGSKDSYRVRRDWEGVIQEGDKSVEWEITGTIWEMVVNPETAIGV